MIALAIAATLALAPIAEPVEARPVEGVLSAAAEQAAARAFLRDAADAYALVAMIDAQRAAELTAVAAYLDAAGARAEPRTDPHGPSPTARASAQTAPASTRCGTDGLPTCGIMECESGGSLTARNPNSSAAGKWQITRGTWNGYMGYASAADAPEEIQDARARELWQGGAGASHWEQCL